MPHIDAIRFRKYKSFGEEYSTIPLKRMTVLIGRNNSGKSSCIDVIEALCKPDTLASLKMGSLDLLVDRTLSDDEWMDLFLKSGYSQWQYPSLNQFQGKICSFKIYTQNNGKHHSAYSDMVHIDEKELNTMIHWSELENQLDVFIKKIHFVRINAERDIIPELENPKEQVDEKGTGATSLINLILNHDGQDEWLIQHDLLNALNDIILPDASYSRIDVKKIRNEKWEVFLYEGDEKYALSQMGSGLKTVILVLLSLIVIPQIRNFSFFEEATCIYAFEELENNLHPALQRRLFKYIDAYIEDHPNTYVFLTTHSHVPINMFAGRKGAQILHVTKEGGVSSLHVINDFITKSEVLNDLDVRASDLLQSNGIIWVEGPSDRVYIKHWIEIWGGGDLCEGIDYQFLYYGGRLLSHYTADGSENQEEQVDENLIKILKINRNAVIVMDSDITEKRPDINKTKERIQEEFKQNNMLCWITVGKEIENYIPCQAINSAYGCDLSQCGLNKLFPTYIKKNAITKKEFGKGKVPFASEVVKHITVEDSTHVPKSDLEQRMTELIKIIRGWTPDKSEPDTKSAQT